MLKDRKILNWVQPVTSLDDKPKLTAAALKAAFDSNTNELKPALNGMIDDLTGTGGAGNVGTSPIDGVTGTDVQTMLAFLKGLIDLRDPTENVDQKLALKADKAVTDRHIKTVGFNGKTGVFTFTREDGTSQTVDTMLEKVPVRCYLDGQTFVLVLEDGTEQRADLSAFLTKTEFTDSGTIDFAVSGETVTASVKAGSITLAMLESTVMSTLQGYMTAAQTAAGNAKTSETNAAAHKDAAAKSASASAQSAAESAGHAKNAQSWAAGGTNSRPGEDTDNAKFYAKQAGVSADDAAQQMTAASASAAEARESAAGAAGSAQRAEQAAKDAEAIAGGNFIPMSQKGEKNGVASLDASGKVPSGQLPEMNYDAAGSADAVDKKLTAHAGDGVKHVTAGERQAWNAKTDDTVVDAHKKDKNNPHGVTAAQVGAPTTAAFNGHTGDGVKHVTAEERTKWNGKGAPYRHTFTLTAAGWAGTPAKQTVTVSGVTAALTPVADVVLSGDAAADKLILEGWGKVSRMVTGAGNVTATCYEEKPGVSLPVQLVGCK